MLKGDVQFRASVENHCLEFDEVSINGRHPSITQVQFRCDATQGISIAITLENMSTEEEGVRIAREEADHLLDTLAFERSVPIGPPQMTSQSFSPMVEPEGKHTISSTMALHLRSDARVINRVQPATILNQVNNAAPATATHKTMFRQAIRSSGGVERFMHLYNLLLMLHNDRQSDVDQFIRNIEPGVAQSPSPRFQKVNETIYTRLRNEFGHTRTGVNLDNTKAEMCQHVGQLLQHVRAAMNAAASNST